VELGKDRAKEREREREREKGEAKIERKIAGGWCKDGTTRKRVRQ